MASQSNLLNITFPEFAPTEILDIKHSRQSHLLLVLLSNRVVQILHDKTYKVLRQIKLDSTYDPIKVFFSLNKTLVVVTANGLILIYSLSNPNLPIKTFVVDCDGVTNADYKCTESPNEDQEFEEYLLFCGGDGSVHIYYNTVSQNEYSALEVHYLLKTILYNLNDIKSECLCAEMNLKEMTVFLGYANGRVKKYNLKNSNMACWNSKLGNNFSVRVLSIFNEDFIIIGGSSGKVFSLDSKFGSITRTFNNCSISDVTSMQNDLANGLVYFTGYDSRIFVLKFDEMERDFKIVGKNRGQTHDVNSLALIGSELLSGGKTSDICIMKVDKNGFGESETQRKKHVQQSLFEFVFHSSDNTIGYFYNDQVTLVRFEQKKPEEQSDQLSSSIPNYNSTVLLKLYTDKSINQIQFCEKTGILVLSYLLEEKLRFYRISDGEIIKELPLKCTKMLISRNKLFVIEHTKNALKIINLNDFSKEMIHIELKTFQEFQNFIDFFEVSQSHQFCLIGNHFEAKLIIVNLRNSSISDVSYLLKGKNVQFVRFLGASDKVFYMTNNNKIFIFKTSKQANFALDLKENIGLNFGTIKDIVFPNGETKKVILSSDYYMICLDIEKLTFKPKKRENPSLYFGKINANTLISLNVDWSSAVKILKEPINTKKFIKNN